MVSNFGLTVVENGKPLVGREVPVYEPEEGELLIRNESVAQNPIDWKSADYNFEGLIPKLPAVIGTDTAGVVEKVGKGVTSFKQGDRVVSMTPLGKDSRFGVYQKYTISKASTTVKLPDAYSFDEAATIPLAYYTAAQGLFCELDLPVPQMSSGGLGGGPGEGKPILIWGAASSVGMYAVQLAALAGFKVIGIASERNWAYVKELGAVEAFDYRDPDVVEKIKKAAPDLEYIFDSITENGSSETALKTLANGGHIAITLGFDGAPTNVKIHNVAVGAVYSDEKRANIITELLNRLLQAGKLRPNPIKVMPNGLESLNDGWQLMRDGKVRAQKLIYHPQE